MKTKTLTQKLTHTKISGDGEKSLNSVFGEFDNTYLAFTAPDSFQHITLNTGHSCNQSREADGYDAAELLSQVIAEGLADGGWTDLKRFGEASALRVSVSGTTLLAELYLPCKVPKAAKPVILIGISAGTSPSTDTWNYLHANAVELGRGVLSNPPKTPWIGAALTDSLMLTGDLKQVSEYLAMMNWVGDFESCLAWGFVAWLESTTSALLHKASPLSW